MIHITIPGQAVPMYRPRSSGHFSRRLGRWISHTYNPRVMVNYERYARLQGIAQYGGKPLKDMPLFVKCIVFVKMPKSWSKRKKKLMENAFCTKRPDLDNYGKDIVDAFNKLIYKDDNLMVKELLAKRYSKNPRVEFYVERAKNYIK